MGKLIGFRGRTATKKALARSRYASNNPSTYEMPDGSLVGVGDTLLMRDGSRDVMLYGARGSYALLSTVA